MTSVLLPNNIDLENTIKLIYLQLKFIYFFLSNLNKNVQTAGKLDFFKSKMQFR